MEIAIYANAWYPAGNATWKNNFPEDAYHVIWHPGCGGAHTFVDEEAVEPTCETNGKLSSTYCNTCGLVSVYPTEIPAFGHNYGAWKYISPDGTPARERMVVRICETCSHEQKEYAYKLNPVDLPAEAPSDTQPISPDEKEPIRFTGGQIVIIAIVVVTVCFVGVEVYFADFIFGGKKPISYTIVRGMCRRIKKDVLFEENITPKRFRTTVLTDMYDQTKDIKLVQAAAGHATSTMTLKHYVKCRQTDERGAAAIEKLYTA